jgi:hypothetical protein
MSNAAVPLPSRQELLLLLLSRSVESFIQTSTERIMRLQDLYLADIRRVRGVYPYGAGWRMFGLCGSALLMSLLIFFCGVGNAVAQADPVPLPAEINQVECWPSGDVAVGGSEQLSPEDGEANTWGIWTSVDCHQGVTGFLFA